MSGWLFNGTSDFARSNAPAVTSYPFTMLIVAETNALTTGQCPWEMCDSASESQSFRFQINVTTNSFDTIATAGTSQIASTANVITAANTPFVGIGRFTSATLRESILNGDIANMGTNTTSRIPTGINRCSFGVRDDPTPTPFFPGTIFYAALWNVVLSNNECIALSKGISPLMISPASLLNYWDTFDGSSGTIRDLKNASPLTTSGGTASTANAPLFIGRGGSVLRPIPGVFVASTPSFIHQPTSPAQMNFLMR